MVDSTNAVGYVVACNSSGPSEPQITQFGVSGTSIPSKAVAALNYAGDDEYGCGAPVAPYDPTPNNQYFIGGPTATNAAVTACFAAHYPGFFGFGASWYVGLETFQFTTGTMKTTNYGFAYQATSAATTCSPLEEFYGSAVSNTITGLTQTGTTVSVTLGTNTFVAGQSIVISNIAANGANCTAADIAWINGEQTVLAAGNPLTFTAPVSTSVSGCTLTGATAVGPTVDYLFVGTSAPAEAYSFTLPMVNGTPTSGAPGRQASPPMQPAERAT